MTIRGSWLPRFLFKWKEYLWKLYSKFKHDTTRMSKEKEKRHQFSLSLSPTKILPITSPSFAGDHDLDGSTRSRASSLKGLEGFFQFEAMSNERLHIDLAWCYHIQCQRIAGENKNLIVMIITLLIPIHSLLLYLRFFLIHSFNFLHLFIKQSSILFSHLFEAYQ